MDIKNKNMNYLVKEFDKFDVIDKSLEKQFIKSAQQTKNRGKLLGKRESTKKPIIKIIHKSEITLLPELRNKTKMFTSTISIQCCFRFYSV